MKNTVKKLVALLFALALIMSAAGCADKPVANNSEIVGKWKYPLNENLREIITEYLVDPAVYNDIYYEFNEDGTGCTYTTLDPTPVKFTYTYNGKTLSVSMGDQSFDTDCIIKGDSMTITEYGEKIVFHKD